MSAATDRSALLAPAPRMQACDRSLLRFITCGSVDDGKSTLIGRLLHDTGAVLEDHMESLQHESKKYRTTDEKLNFALLVDGLSAEREQGITIDVAYRYFSTERRLFIIADTPGHEQYTRNMATGASQADLAIILIDARKGVLPQTRRHSFITSMVGIRSVVIAINKMDLVNFDKAVFDRIVREYKSLLPMLDFRDVTFIPLSAQLGINVVHKSNRMSWYNGPSLFSYLESVEVADPGHASGPFLLPVQWISRYHSDFRGFCGTIANGTISKGSAVRSLPSGRKSRVRKIYTPAGESDHVSAGEAVTLTLEDEIDTSRGDVLVSEDPSIAPSRALSSQILWMSERPMVMGKRYFIKIATALVSARITQLEEKIDIHTYCSEPAKSLAPNEIGHVILNLESTVIAAPYKDSRVLGAFILIDAITNETAALGIVRNTFATPRVTKNRSTPPAMTARFKNMWFGRHTVNRGRFIMFRLVSAAILALLAVALDAVIIGAAAVFIFDFILRPCLEMLFFPATPAEQPPVESGAGI